MKSYQNSFNEFQYYITPSDMIEFLYCKRFIYYMKCLGIKQYEDKRYKVEKGRELHRKKENENKDYLRKKLGVVDKKINIDLYSDKYKIKGKVDEVLIFDDNTMAPLDYKFAEFNDILYSTYKTQMLMYSLMIEELYNCKVNKAYLVYSPAHIEEIARGSIEGKLKKDISEYTKVIEGYYPKGSKSKARCLDCCYRNICIK